MRSFVAAGIAAIVVVVMVALAQVRPGELDGVRNFTVVDTKTACAGATEPRALAAIAERGYKAVVNLRLETETGAAIDESRAAATKAGLKYIHLPLDPVKPDMAVADAFILAASDPSNQPLYVHCASGQRASALLLAKRVLVDKWATDRALTEAHSIGLTNAALERFALDYVAARAK